jgi:hypothetical protein
MSQSSDPGSALIGTWKLLAVRFEFADGGGSREPFGPAPRGRLIVTGTGDFMTVITSADRAVMRDTIRLFETMMAYAGKFRLEGNKLVISCDLSWYPDWVGTEQVRFFELDGDKLSIRTAKQTHPRYPDRLGYGVIDWTREG